MHVVPHPSLPLKASAALQVQLHDLASYTSALEAQLWEKEEEEEKEAAAKDEEKGGRPCRNCVR